MNVDNLRQIDRAGQPNLNWEYNDFGVFQDKTTGLFYWAVTVGCSCYLPYEGYVEDDYTQFQTFNELKVALESWADMENEEWKMEVHILLQYVDKKFSLPTGCETE
jgi:hypothetical protein